MLPAFQTTRLIRDIMQINMIPGTAIAGSRKIFSDLQYSTHRTPDLDAGGDNSLNLVVDLILRSYRRHEARMSTLSEGIYTHPLSLT